MSYQPRPGGRPNYSAYGSPSRPVYNPPPPMVAGGRYGSPYGAPPSPYATGPAYPSRDPYTSYTTEYPSGTYIPSATSYTTAPVTSYVTETVPAATSAPTSSSRASAASSVSSFHPAADDELASVSSRASSSRRYDPAPVSSSTVYETSSAMPPSRYERAVVPVEDPRARGFSAAPTATTVAAPSRDLEVLRAAQQERREREVAAYGDSMFASPLDEFMNEMAMGPFSGGGAHMGMGGMMQQMQKMMELMMGDMAAGMGGMQLESMGRPTRGGDGRRGGGEGFFSSSAVMMSSGNGETFVSQQSVSSAPGMYEARRNVYDSRHGTRMGHTRALGEEGSERGYTRVLQRDLQGREETGETFNNLTEEDLPRFHDDWRTAAGRYGSGTQLPSSSSAGAGRYAGARESGARLGYY